MKEQVQPGKYVLLTYVISDEEGSVVEQNDIPVGYIFGGDTELLGGMDSILVGKSAGDEVSSKIPPEKGFGQPNPDLIFSDGIENVPPQYRKIGAEVQMQNEQGESKIFYVSKIENGILTVDGNHPLAGKTVTLKVKILEVREATEEDLRDTAIQSENSPTLN
jgi:FKBP-type peptidyl-prolyl cis-trans isomerase SlyD